MDVKLITLKTNHTLIGQVSEESDHVLIKQPIQVFMQPSKDGMQIGFGPFLDFAEEHATGFKIDRTDILCISTPVIDLRNQYSNIFGSGIQIATAVPNL